MWANRTNGHVSCPANQMKKKETFLFIQWENSTNNISTVSNFSI